MYPNNKTRISEFVKQLWVILKPSREYEKHLLITLHDKKVPLSVVKRVLRKFYEELSRSSENR